MCKAKWGNSYNWVIVFHSFCRRSKDSEKLDVFRPATEHHKDNHIIRGHIGSKMEYFVGLFHISPFSANKSAQVILW